MPSDVFFTGNGLRLAVMRSGNNSVSTFDVDSSGALSDQQTINVGSQPVGGAATSRLPWTGFAAIVKDPGPAAVVSFQTPRASTIFYGVGANVDTDPCWATTSVNGQRLWTSNFQPKTLTLYRVDSDSSLVREGLYEPAPGIGPGSLDLDVSADGRFLYRLRAFNIKSQNPSDQPSPIVEVFQINPSNANGGLSLIQSVQVPIVALQSASPTGMAVADPQ
jgi:hypothetical protein